MRAPSTTRAAAGAVGGMVLVTSVLVLTTGLRVEDFGPIIVYGVALAAVALLLAPPRKAR